MFALQSRYGKAPDDEFGGDFDIAVYALTPSGSIYCRGERYDADQVEHSYILN